MQMNPTLILNNQTELDGERKEPETERERDYEEE